MALPNKALKLTRTSVEFFYSVSVRGQLILDVEAVGKRFDRKAVKKMPLNWAYKQRSQMRGSFWVPKFFEFFGFPTDSLGTAEASAVESDQVKGYERVKNTIR